MSARTLHQGQSPAGPHGIEAHVPGAGVQVILVHGEGGETTPPKMAGPTFTLVDPARVAHMRHGDGRGERPTFARSGDRVDVVGHQAIGPHRHVGGGETLGGWRRPVTP